MDTLRFLIGVTCLFAACSGDRENGAGNAGTLPDAGVGGYSGNGGAEAAGSGGLPSNGGASIRMGTGGLGSWGTGGGIWAGGAVNAAGGSPGLGGGMPGGTGGALSAGGAAAPVCEPDGACTPGEVGAQECGNGVCCGPICRAGTNGCPSFWDTECSGTPQCQIYEEACTSTTDCCRSVDVCIGFGDVRRCVPPCTTGADCASGCCVPLTNSGRTCVTQDMADLYCPPGAGGATGSGGARGSGGSASSCNDANCPPNCTSGDNYVCCNICGPTCRQSCSYF